VVFMHGMYMRSVVVRGVFMPGMLVGSVSL
jgi:hypothetical protein